MSAFQKKQEFFEQGSELEDYEDSEILGNDSELDLESDELDVSPQELEAEEEIGQRSRVPLHPLRTRPLRPRPQPAARRPPGYRPKPPRVIRKHPRSRFIHEPVTCICPEKACPEHGTEYIRWVQSALNDVLGLRFPVNGIMGPETRSAVRSFQQREGLPVDGIVGPDIESALIAARGGKSPQAGAARSAEPGMMEPSEPGTTPPAPGMTEPAEPATPAPAAEFDFEWETFDDEFEFTDQESHSGLTRPVPKTIWLHNTDLDAPYFGGNFNFLYRGGSNEALITFNTHLSYRKNYSEAEKRNFINNLKRAVDVWDSAAEVQVKDINGNYNDKIKLRFKLNIVRDPKNSNKKTDIHPNASRSTWFIGKGRETAMRELNAFIGSSRNVLVHELGHVWGLLDEYDTRWIEKKFSLGHVGTGSPLIKDKIAIMNEGYMDETGNTGEFRGRYFKHFGRAILNAFWGLKSYVIPIKHNGKVVTRSVQGRIALLKKDIAGSAPYANDVLPFNPRFTVIQVAKK